MRLRLPLAVGAAGVLTLSLVAAAPSALAGPAAAPACRPSVTVLPLPTWAKGGTVAAAAAGVAVGSVTAGNGTTRAMRWQKPGARWALSPIPGVAALGAVSSDATGVNRHGAITVSVYESGSTATRAFVAAGGLLQPLLDGARRYNSYAADISDSGTVVGSAYSEGDGTRLPVRWDYWDQVPRGLGFSGGYSSATATAIDANDDIAGSAFWSPHLGGYGFRIDGDGNRMPLGDGRTRPGGMPLGYDAVDLNSSERTVGYGVLATGTGAIVWDGGVPTVLPRFAGAGSSSAAATAVSESGVVVGYEDDRSSSETPPVRHVLLWTDAGGVRSLLPASGRWTDPARADAIDGAGTAYGTSYSTSLSQHPGELVPTAWTCAVAQAFVPTATGVPASAPRPDVVVEQE